MPERKHVFIALLALSIFIAFFIDIGFIAYIYGDIGYAAVDKNSQQQGHSVSPIFFIVNLLTTIRWAGDILSRHPNEIIAGFTVILTIVTAKLAKYTYLLWNDARSTSARQGEEMRQSIALATRNTLTHEAYIRIVERSYISVDNFDILNFMENAAPTITYQAINSGRIPAALREQLVKYHIGVSIPDAPSYEGAIERGRSIVRPFNYITSPTRCNEILTPDIFEKLVNREFCIFLWGKIIYTDTLREDHFTAYGTKAIFQEWMQNGHGLWTFEILPGYSDVS